MTGIFIIARLGSTRLSQKHLIEVAGKSFIQWLVSRYAFAFDDEIKNGQVAIYIVTSEQEENKRFESVFASYPYIKIFYGSDSNIPLRQLQCAEANHIDAIISIDGDDVLCSTAAAVLVREKLLDNKQIIKTSGLPLGMNVMGYQKSYLQKCLANHSQSTLETGWGRIFDTDTADTIYLGQYDSDKRLRLTLDYEEDARFFKKIIGGLQDQILTIEDTELIDYIIENKLYETNQDVNDTYWQNFDQQKQAESQE